MNQNARVVSRRTFVAQALVIGSAGQLLGVEAQTPVATPVTVTSLGHGLEVRDYRLFPTKDVPRFIVELHNSTDLAVDAPALGVVLPHLPRQQGFAVATPVSEVLHPHTSLMLIGVAPTGLASDSNWGTPEWTFCGEISTHRVEELQKYDVTIEYEWEKRSNIVARAVVTGTNNQDRTLVDRVQYEGTVFDAAGRICGITQPWLASMLGPRETKEYHLYISGAVSYIGSPFALIDEVDGTSVEVTVQPRPIYRNPVCPIVMPWNDQPKGKAIFTQHSEVEH